MMLLLLLTGLPVGAETSGNFTYTVSADGTATITECSSKETNVVIPDTLDGYRVTGIGGYAFYNCKDIRTLTIPSSIRLVDADTFIDAEGITDIYYTGTRLQWHQIDIKKFSFPPYGATMHYTDDVETKDMNWSIDDNGVLTITGQGDTGTLVSGKGDMPWEDRLDDIRKVVIGEGITSIGEYSFYMCDNLTEVQLPESLIYIESNAFGSCKQLKTVNIPKNVTYLGERAFYRCAFEEITLPESLVCTGWYVFEGCTALKSITIPNGVTKIAEHSFADCENLSSVNIPSSVTDIGMGAFNRCKNLSSITIPNSVKTVGSRAFYDTAFLSSLRTENPNDAIYIGKTLYEYNGDMPTDTELTVKDGTVTILSDAFYQCSGLSAITIPRSVTSIGSYALYTDSLKDIYYDGSADEWNRINMGSNVYKKTVTVHFSEGSTDTIQWQYNKSTATLSITGSGAMESLSDAAGDLPWEHLSSKVAKVEISDGITSICNNAFNGMTNLSEVIIPDSVSSIGIDSFKGTAWLNNQSDSIVYINNVAYTYKGESAEAETITIKEGTTHIAPYAFANLTKIDSLILPGSLEAIGDYAFSSNVFINVIRYRGMANDFSGIIWGAGNDSVCGATTYIEYLMGMCGDNLTWSFDANKTLTISGTGEMYGSNTANLWWTYNDEIENVIIEDGVTTIGYGAFIQHINLKEVSIPKSVSKIGNYAFDSCAALTTIDVADDNLVFSSQDGILYNKNKTELILYPAGKTDKTFAVPEGIKTIATSAFEHCALNELILSASVTNIGGPEQSSTTSSNWGLAAMEMLETVIVDAENKNYRSIDGVLFELTDNGMTLLLYPHKKVSENIYAIPEGVTYIGGDSFVNNFPNNIVLPSTLTSINRYALKSTTKEINIYYNGTSDNLSTIKNIESYEVKSLKGSIKPGISWEVSIDGVLKFDGSGEITDSYDKETDWHGNGLVSKAVIGKDITRIGDDTFFWLQNLSDIAVDSENAYYISENGVLFNKNKTTLLCYPSGKTNKSYTIPATVKNIEYHAFSSNEFIENIAIGKTTEYIEAKFVGDSCIKRIYYGGSQEEWEKLASEIYLNNNTEIHYNYLVGESGKIRGTAQKTANGYVITADVENVMGDCIILVAGYKDGKFIKMTRYNVTSGAILDADVDSIKVMAWDGLGNLIPVAESLTLDVN